MRYSKLESRVSNLVRSATPAARLRFGLDTVTLLQGRAGHAIAAQLSASERASLLEILGHLESRPANDLAAGFGAFLKTFKADDVRSTEFHQDLIELLCAVDGFISYRCAGDPAQVVRIAISAINSVDYHIEGRAGAYSVDNMLGSPQMVAEYERQQLLLAP